MKKKLLVCLIGCMLTFSLVGCGETTTISVNVENSEELSSPTLGEDNLISIGNNLYYDSATRIVYLKNSTYSGWSVFTAYYAPNGLPYKYNSETSTFEKIE